MTFSYRGEWGLAPSRWAPSPTPHLVPPPRFDLTMVAARRLIYLKGFLVKAVSTALGHTSRLARTTGRIGGSGLVPARSRPEDLLAFVSIRNGSSESIFRFGAVDWRSALLVLGHNFSDRPVSVVVLSQQGQQHDADARSTLRPLRRRTSTVLLAESGKSRKGLVNAPHFLRKVLFPLLQSSYCVAHRIGVCHA